jgi:hypothetical protein
MDVRAFRAGVVENRLYVYSRTAKTHESKERLCCSVLDAARTPNAILSYTGLYGL